MIDDNGNKTTKDTDIHKAAVVENTVSDTLLWTALNVLIKSITILSLIFASKFNDLHKPA